MARHVNFGNSGGKKGRSGRRSKAEEMGLVALLYECVSDADRRACFEQLAKDCKSEDFHERHEARKLLLAYIYGKPTEKREHSGEGGDPVTLHVVYDQPLTDNPAELTRFADGTI